MKKAMLHWLKKLIGSRPYCAVRGYVRCGLMGHLEEILLPRITIPCHGNRSISNHNVHGCKCTLIEYMTNFSRWFGEGSLSSTLHYRFNIWDRRIQMIFVISSILLYLLSIILPSCFSSLPTTTLFPSAFFMCNVLSLGLRWPQNCPIYRISLLCVKNTTTIVCWFLFQPNILWIFLCVFSKPRREGK